MNWQSATVLAAATYVRERIHAGDNHAHTKAIYEGLLDLLDPNRRVARMQLVTGAAKIAAATAAATQAERDRRAIERRRRPDRRKANLGAPAGVERRASRDRRAGRDRRKR
jgi:hypothetical protein